MLSKPYSNQYVVGTRRSNLSIETTVYKSYREIKRARSSVPTDGKPSSLSSNTSYDIVSRVRVSRTRVIVNGTLLSFRVRILYRRKNGVLNGTHTVYTLRGSFGSVSFDSSDDNHRLWLPRRKKYVCGKTDGRSRSSRGGGNAVFAVTARVSYCSRSGPVDSQWLGNAAAGRLLHGHTFNICFVFL